MKGEIAFLLDCDNTLLDNDRVVADLSGARYALDPRIVGAYPPADRMIDRMGDLVAYPLSAFLDVAHPVERSKESP